MKVRSQHAAICTDNQLSLLFLGAKSEAGGAGKPIYRIFIFGLALAESCGLSYTDIARCLYDFTRRTALMHSARPKIKILYTAFLAIITVKISLGRNATHCLSVVSGACS